MTTCDFCGDPIGGGPGGWFSLKTTMERCVKSPTAFHEPRPDPRTMADALRYISRPTAMRMHPAKAILTFCSVAWCRAKSAGSVAGSLSPSRHSAMTEDGSTGAGNDRDSSVTNENTATEATSRRCPTCGGVVSTTVPLAEQCRCLVCLCGHAYDPTVEQHDCDARRNLRARKRQEALDRAYALTDDDLLDLLVKRDVLRFYSVCSAHQDPQDDCENCRIGSWGLRSFNGRWARRAASPSEADAAPDAEVNQP